MTLFAYGTLMDEKLVRQLLGHSVVMIPAILEHHVRLEPSYYMTFPHFASRVEGMLITGLSKDDIARFDKYEGNGFGYYTRTSVWVTIEGNSYPVRTEAYLGGEHMTWFYNNWVEAQGKNN